MDRDEIIEWLERILSFLCYIARLAWIILFLIILTFVIRSCNDSLEQESENVFGKAKIINKK